MPIPPFPVIKVDSRRCSASERWVGLTDIREDARALIDYYFKEVEASGHWPPARRIIKLLATRITPKSLRREILDHATLLDLDPDQLLALNLYYDLVLVALNFRGQADVHKLLRQSAVAFIRGQPFGCTAFAFVNTAGHPMHARNLDWPCEGRVLEKGTAIFDHQLSSGRFQSVGWPGFVGSLTGIRPGAFTVSVNMVSTGRFSVGLPVPMLVRKALEVADSYTAAVKLLSETKVMSEVIFLVTGTIPAEMVVIERSPDSFAHRGPNAEGLLVATNDFRALKSGLSTAPQSELQITNDQRFAAVEMLCSDASFRRDGQSCFDVLGSSLVRLLCTKQHILMCAATGDLEVRPAGPACPA